MIFVDMDEVLVDFVGGVCKVFDISKKALFTHHRPEVWNITPAISKVLGKEVTESDLWREIDKHGSEFWEQLEKLPWADELLELVEEYDNYCIVTSPSYHPHCYDGKTKWLKRKFGFEYQDFMITKHKELLSREGRVLIDDKEDNIQKFLRYGGHGILFPAQINKLKGTDPIAYVKGALDQLCQ